MKFSIWEKWETNGGKVRNHWGKDGHLNKWN